MKRPVFHVVRMKTQLRPSCRTTHKVGQVSCVVLILIIRAY